MKRFNLGSERPAHFFTETAYKPPRLMSIPSSDLKATFWDNYKGAPMLELWTARTRNLGEPLAFERPLKAIKGPFKRGLEGI